MQSLGDTNRLPRLIAGAGSNGLGDLRPGRERAFASGDRTLIAERTPQHIASRGETRGRAFCWFVFLLLAGGTASVFHLPPPVFEKVRGWTDQLAVKAGFAVDHVAVIGHDKTSMAQIVGVLDLDTEKSLLGFNGTVVRNRLQKLPWIDTVRVVHILPDTVSIRITERKPFAVWQHEGQHYLVDRSGHTLAKYEGSAVGLPYPLVVGKGAGVAARKFLDQIGQHPAIAAQVRAAVRVADRRWNIILKSGKKILLPERGLRTALTTLDALFVNKAMTVRNVAMIDLRIPARPTVRLQRSVSKTLEDIKQSRRAAAMLLAGDAS